MNLKINPNCQTLVNFINSPEKINENSERFYELIEMICQQKINLQIEYDGLNYCCHCQEFLIENNYKILPCGHNVHFECFKNYLSEQPFYIESIDTYSCCKESETCSQVLITDELSKFILGEEEFNNFRNLFVLDQQDNNDIFDFQEQQIEQQQDSIDQKENEKQIQNQTLNDYEIAKKIEQEEQLQKKENQKKITFECLICYNSYEVEQDAITLECDHRFCKNCVQELISNSKQLGKYKEEDLVCPQCNQPINFYIIQHCCPDESSKINDYRTLNLIIDSPEERTVGCPGVGCPGKFVISRQLEFPICTICKLQFCANGCEKVHIGMSCEEYRKKIRPKQEKGQVQCPKCKILIFKDGGCNHITCICKHEFCFVCSKPYKPKRECNCPQMTIVERFVEQVKDFIKIR